jgi:hypothetical protein
MIMKRTITTISLAVFVSSLFAIGVAFKAPGGGRGSIVPSVQAKDEGDDKGGCPGNCSLRTLNGCYGFTFSGTILGLGPIAGIGVTNFDGQGHLTSTDTVNINGSGGIPETGTGTYTVNSDCTGSEVSTRSPSGLVVTTNFVIVNHGKEVLFVNTAPGLAITGSLKKQ